MRDHGLSGEVRAELQVHLPEAPARGAGEFVRVFVLCPDRFEDLGRPPPETRAAAVKEKLHERGAVPPEEQRLGIKDEERIGDLDGARAEMLIRAHYETPAHIISGIRFKYYADDDIAEDTERTRSSLNMLQKCIESLAKDINSSVDHFLYEFVQNADDCDYRPDVAPNMLFVVRRNGLAVRYNHRGLLRENMLALCDIKASTKRCD